MVEGHGTSCVRVRVPPWAQMKETFAHPWASMRGNMRNTGCGVRKASQITKIQDGIKRLSTKGAIFSTPVITADETIICGSADGIVYAYNPLSDSVNWQVETGGAIDCAAAITREGEVYSPSCDGKLYKINTKGEVLWEFDVIHTRVAPTPSSIFWWEGNAALDKDENVYAGNDDFYLYSLTPTGDVRWSFPTALNIWTTPAIFENLVIFCSFDFHVYALEKDTGALMWKTRIDNFCVSSPAISEHGVVYIGTFGKTLYAIDVRTGSILHSRMLQEHVYASVVVDDEREKIYVGDALGSMYALSGNDLTTIWELPLQGAIRASAALYIDFDSGERTLYCADGAGFLHACTEDGELLWSVQLVEGEEAIPDMCASIALGYSGLSLATVSGEIVWIPYTYKPEQKEIEDAIKENGLARGVSEDLHGEYTCTIRNILFKDPPIISSFDLVAIASVEYQLQFSVSGNGTITGIGTASFGSEEGADGVTIARTLSYTLEGEVSHSGVFSVRAHNCMFELSAFPIPIDILEFSGVLAGAKITHRKVTLTKKKKNTLKALAAILTPQSITFAWKYLQKILASGVLFSNPLLVLRTLGVALRVLQPRVQRAWNLQNAQGDIVAEGTYTSSDIY